MPTLTVLFDDQYWVGVIEVADGAARRVYHHIFGSEPSGPEVHLFILHELAAILNRGDCGVADGGEPAPAPARRANPKRLAREAARATARQGVDPQAAALLREATLAAKSEREAAARRLRDEQAALKRAKALAKAREKRRGH